ncbi:MAG: HsdR family type I site-specific deoxyribonuclease [Candidatus Shapirobacteria bacterium]|nr:HsdR family type I site-specific deoxyribonuclease [Candidatus Shapirobacteria bacterium]
MKFNEQYTVENHIIKYISQTLDFDYIKPEEFAKLREFENEYLVIPELFEAIKRINNLNDDGKVQSVIREIKKIDTNEEFLNLLRNGVNIKDPKTGKNRDYLVVDYDNIDNNHFVVTNQFYFEGNLENIRPDIMVFINGIPVVDIEAKSPTASEIVDYTKAIGQLKRYERNAIKLFWPNCFNIATDGLKTVYGATYAPTQYFLQWKDEFENKDDEELEITLKALLSKNNLLDIIGNFILFEKEKEQKIKKIARYQQIRATNKIVERVRGKEKKRGLVWHTQGSGKSLTMFFTAWKLRFDKQLKNPKVFILVDRIDLDDQISDTFGNCGGKNIIRVTSRVDLEKKIKSSERGIFISTIQKFNELGKDIESFDGNVIVLSDEAHRDNEGIAAIKLRSSMKDAFFFGFTGTPIDKKTLNTHRNFGQEGERYLDYYSIQQAIDDGATLPVAYEARLSKFSIDEDKVDQQFDELTDDLTKEQKTALTKKYGRMEALIKLDKRMKAVAQDIVEHFRTHIEPNGFKAQVVCYDREATAKYKKIFDELLPKEWTEVVYSSGDPNSDSDTLEKYNTNKKQREKIIENFKKKESLPKLLLVCDMLLTGFDAPIEQAMYLDKPLRDHNLLQAIARTNRVYQNKGCGRIIDYYGITNNLYKALDFDETIVASAMFDIDKFKVEFEQNIGEIMEVFVGVNIEDPSISNLRRCLKIFIDNSEKQNYFSNKYSRLKLLFEILSPDPFLLPYLRKFEWITCFYLAFKKEYSNENDDKNALAEYGEKVKTIIQEKIDFEGITKNFREMRINDIYTIDKLRKAEPEEKAEMLLKIIKNEINANIDSDYTFVSFSQKLLTIQKEFEKHQIDLSDRIKKYQELLEDIKNRGDEAKKVGLDMKEYGLYLITKEYSEFSEDKNIISFVQDLSKNLRNLLDKGWQDTAKKEEFIKGIKQQLQMSLLRDYKEKMIISDFPKLMNRLVDIIVKNF